MTEFSSFIPREKKSLHHVLVAGERRREENHFANATYLLIADLESSSSESGSLKRKRIERKVN